jgi:hypothetical protein
LSLLIVMGGITEAPFPAFQLIMVNSDDDFDQLAESLENGKFDVKIGVKGQLSTSHSNS